MAKKPATKPHAAQRAATAAVLNPGSLAGIGGAVATLGAIFDPGNADLWAKLGGSVSMLAIGAAGYFGAREQRAPGSSGR